MPLPRTQKKENDQLSFPITCHQVGPGLSWHLSKSISILYGMMSIKIALLLTLNSLEARSNTPYSFPPL